jgi:hypothetical protein
MFKFKRGLDQLRDRSKPMASPGIDAIMRHERLESRGIRRLVTSSKHHGAHGKQRGLWNGE